MKNPTALLTAKVEGTFDNSSAHAMGIDAAGLAIVMQTLSNMYSNGSLAVVREYACNARDSHVEAGQTRPIEVSLPSRFDPMLRVQDFGIGLTKDEIIKVYAQYGASTKRDSNDMIGAFGIGSKSAFTVGNQFTVAAVKAGVKTVALFSINESGLPTVQILHEGPTNEPNGVLVEVACDNPAAVEEAAKDLFLAWPKGSVLVDDEAPESMWDTLDEVATDVYLNLKDEFTWQDRRITVVMGGVPYSVPDSVWNMLSYDLRNIRDTFMHRNAGIVLVVGIGDVDITPSREELRATTRTKATIGRMLELFQNSLPSYMTSKVENAPTMWAAGRAYAALVQRLGMKTPSHQVYYKGRSLGNENVELPYPSFDTHTKRYGGLPYVRQIDGRAFTITQSFNDVLIVTDVPEDKETTVRRYVRVMNQELDVKTVVCSPKSSEAINWFSYGHADDEIKSMTYDDYRKKGLEIRKANFVSAGPRSKTRYPTYSADSSYSTDMDADEIIATGKTPMYSVSGDSFYWHSPIVRKYIKDEDLIIVCVDSRRSPAVLEKNVPDIEPVGDIFKAQAIELIESLSQADLDLYAAAQNDTYSDWNLSPAMRWCIGERNKITNPEITARIDKVVKARKLLKDNAERISELGAVFALSGLEVKGDDKTKMDTYIEENFPLPAYAMINMWGFERSFQGKGDAKSYVIDMLNAG